MGVIVLHYNNPVMGGGFAYSEGFNNVVLYFLQSMFICSVDLFMLISGYFLAKSEKRNLWKIIKLIAQVIIFNAALYLLGVIRGHAFTIKGLFGALLPCNYFVILYCVVFCISPFVGYVMNRLNRKSLNQMMILLILFFSVWPITVDILETFIGHSLTGLNPVSAFGDDNGYTIVNFLLCWIVGAYIHISDMKISGRKWMLVYLGLTILICGYAKIMSSFDVVLELPFSYCSPLIIAEATIAFLGFKQIELGRRKIINKLAKGSFTAYLLHSLFLSHIRIAYFVKKNIVITILHILISVTVIYLICWCAYFVYEKIMSIVWTELKKKITLPEIVAFDNVKIEDKV